MKIAFNALSIGRYGGKEDAIFIIKYLSKLYPENIYFVFLNNNNLKEFQCNIKNYNVHFIKFSSKKEIFLRFIDEFILLPKIVSKNRIDILYTMNIYGPIISGAKKHILKVGNIAPFHREAISHTHSFKHKIRLYTLRNISIIFFFLADGIIVLSKTSTKYIPKLFRKKTIGILQSSDIDTMKINESPNYEDTENSNKMLYNKYLLCVTHIDSYKYLETLIHGFSNFMIRYKDEKVFLRIIGAVRDDNYYKKLLSYKSNYLYGNHIIFEGSKTKREIISAIQGCRLFLFHSLVENCPQTFIEALKLGAPILSCQNSVMPEIGQHSVCYYDIENPFEISEKIYELMNDSEKLKEMSKSSLNRAKEFSWEKTAQETMLFFKAIFKD